MCLTMHDVAASWLMASMTSSPAMVAMVQSAATAPVFLLALAAGAVADKVDKQRLLAGIQFWSALVAACCGISLLLGAMSPLLLLAFTFCSGSAVAMRYPLIAAELPATVPRDQLPAAMGLNALVFNSSRIAAPLAAGVIISAVGTIYVFGLNAVVAIVTGLTILLGRKAAGVRSTSTEPLGSAMRVGLQFIRHSPGLCVTLMRAVLLFLHTAATISLLPLVASGFPSAGASTYGLLFGSIGVGSVLAVMLVLPRVREHNASRAVLTIGPCLIAFAALVTALTPWVPLAALAMVLQGMALTTTANALAVLVQAQLPDWVRARGMAIHLCAITGGTAVGAALWGQVATHTSVPIALIAAAGSGMVCAVAVRLLACTAIPAEDLTSEPARAVRPELSGAELSGTEMLVTITYDIDAEDAPAFLRAMDDTRRSRLRRGATDWRLYRGIDQPNRYVEHVRLPSWEEHERSVERSDASDANLRATRRGFHRGPGEPVVTRQLVQRVPGGPKGH